MTPWGKTWVIQAYPSDLALKMHLSTATYSEVVTTVCKSRDAINAGTVDPSASRYVMISNGSSIVIQFCGRQVDHPVDVDCESGSVEPQYARKHRTRCTVPSCSLGVISKPRSKHRDPAKETLQIAIARSGNQHQHLAENEPIASGTQSTVEMGYSCRTKRATKKRPTRFIMVRANFL